MANRFVNPFPQFFDSTPTALVGAKLFFYQSGGAVKLNTYQRRSLTGPANANPIVLNAAGRPPVNIFLQDLAYRVVLAPATDTDPPTSPIWVADPVYASDFSTTGSVQTFPGNPNGFVAGTAGSGDTPADMIFDTLNNILYIATTTGNAATTVWTAINVSATVSIPAPQGRLTPTSGVPFINTDAVAASTILFTPYNGNLIPVYNGTVFVGIPFSELSLSLVSAHAANNIYDVFAFMNGTTITLVTGPAWASSAVAAGSRGVGAGTTQLSLLNGLRVNAVQITGRNGANTFVIPANTATYLGSIWIDGTNGQVSCLLGFGQNRKFGVWNAYNRGLIILNAGDSTASWNLTTATAIRFSNNNSANKASVFMGLQEEFLDATFDQLLSLAGNVASINADIGIGYNTAAVISGFTGNVVDTASNATARRWIPHSAFQTMPVIGINEANCLERVNSATGTTPVLTLSGGSTAMALTLRYRG
jgi:hypothetical protein